MPDSRDEKSFLRSHFSDEGKVYELTALKPWNKMCEALKKFAGKGVYTGYVDVDSIKDNASYILQLGQVQDTFHLTVNGQPCDFPDQVRKLVDITPQLRNGRNALVIEVVSNLYNRVMTGGGQDRMLPFQIPYVGKGLWYLGDGREADGYYGSWRSCGWEVCL